MLFSESAGADSKPVPQCSVCSLILTLRTLGLYDVLRVWMSDMAWQGDAPWSAPQEEAPESAKRKFLRRAVRLLKPCPKHGLLRGISSPLGEVSPDGGDGGDLSRAERVKEAFTKAALQDFENWLSTPTSTLRFPIHDAPVVSIIVLAYNKAEITFRCMREILAHADAPYEVILLDNASADRTSRLLDRLQGVNVLRSAENLGFVRGCNKAAEAARGKYLLFLNNDAFLTPGALSTMISTLELDPGCGAVGCKLVLPSGRLQEAGSIIWQDGSALGYGRDEHPARPEFNFRREVDFCSAACLLTRAYVFRGIGGFDARYAPAYYEDADLCFAIWESGFRVLYEPAARVHHQEYGSGSPDKSRRLMQTNQVKFSEKWGKRLSRQRAPAVATPWIARSHSTRRHVLYVDDRIPGPDMGSGYPRAYAILKTMVGLGYEVTLFPLQDPTPTQPHLRDLQAAGVEVVCDGRPFKVFAHERKEFYEAAMVSRPHNFRLTRDLIREHFPQALLVYDVEALYSRREELRARVRNDKKLAKAAKRLLSTEMELIRSADAITSVSPSERSFIQEQLGTANKAYVLGHALEARAARTDFDRRKGLLFLGSFPMADSPNEDALLYFIRQIAPHIADGDARGLSIIGANPPASIRRLVSSMVNVLGYVKDIEPWMERSRVFIVPHRFSAGIPLKLCDAMSMGLPAVVSEVTADQMGLTDGKEVLVGRSPKEFAEKVVRLYHNRELWNLLSLNAQMHVQREFAPECMERTLQQVFRDFMPAKPALITA